VWSYNLGTTASAVTTSDLYVFAMSSYTNTIVVLDKNTGDYVKDIVLPGYFQTYGGLVYANGIIYISGYDNDSITTVPYRYNAIHSFDATTGAYLSSAETAQYCYNTAFDGETIWIAANSNTIDGYKVSDENAYEDGVLGNRVKLTVTDAAGNTATKTARVIVQDIMVPVITANGDKNVGTDSGICGATVIVSALATDNCSVITPTGVRSDGELLTAVYPVGTTTIAWNVTDANGNAAVEVIQTVIVTDNEVPVITTDGNKNVSTDSGVCVATIVISASAADNCSVGTPTGVRSDGELLTAVYPVGTTTIAWNVTDANGNAAIQVNQTVTVNSLILNTITRNSDTLTADENGATYQWMTCNGGIYVNLANETNQSYTATVAGSYSVDITKDGCTQRSACFDLTTLGNKDFDFNSKVSVYPNPFKDAISINLDANAKIEIYNLSGAIIYNKKINSGTSLLNLSNNASGMYLMKITTENNESKTVKILKE
jgi:hypothetical protein